MLGDIVTYCGSLLNNIFAMNKIKAVCMTAFSILSYMLGTHIEAFFIISILVLFDLLMAIIRISQTEESFESAKLRHTAIKWVVYGMLLSGAHLAERVTGIPLIAQGVVVVLGATEIVSIFEHANAMGFTVNIPVLKKIKKTRKNV